MVVYLDLVFISGVFLLDQSKDVLHWSTMLSIMILAVTACVPILVLIYLCAKFDSLRDKEGKAKFNTLLLKVDKENRWRIFFPCFFFIRRFVTALLLVLGA